MKLSFSKLCSRESLLFIFSGLCLSISYAGNAQQLDIRDFVLFGGNNTCTTADCGVFVGTSTIVNNGRLGSKSLIKTTGTTQITAHLNSGNQVELANSNTINGNITAGGTAGTIFIAGSNLSLTGNVDVNGNSLVGGGSISGYLKHPGTATYSGPKPIGGELIGTPTIPVLPGLPPISVFEAAGTNNISTTQDITPNRHGAILLDGSKRLTFKGTGTYVFSRIKITGNSNKFIFDFAGSNPTDIFQLQVHGDVDLDKINVELLNGGSSSRIYLEVQGNGSTSASGKTAWSIANGSSGGTSSIWYGSVWAPYGAINVGSGSTPSKVQGSLWSGTQVNLSSGVSVTYSRLAAFCNTPVANAGNDVNIICPTPLQTTLGAATSSGTEYKWTTVIDGVATVVGTTKTVTVTKPGNYTLTVKNSCGTPATDEVLVTYKSCVVTINNTDDDKVDNVIGHELTYLATGNLAEAKKSLIIINNDSVLIEAVAVIGREAEARAFLVGLGLTKIIPNGLSYQKIAGQFPIANLLTINTRPDIINHCLPLFPPLGNAGVITSAGDTSIAANLARGGYNIGGTGIKIGVISDSYNTLANNPAGQDVLNGDLPGVGNPDGNITPVQVLLDYPYGRRSDEGRGMLQIVHDVAPKASLAFRTGFISAGDFAQGIIQLKDAGCQIIVDDVTYITEPFFEDGVVSRAVNDVNTAGVTYFTSAGNFGSRSYQSTYTPTPIAGTFAVSAHNFGGGDIYQKLKLKSGTYTIVMQWQDGIYSLAQPTGTVNDMDIYLIDAGGKTGFNRNNLGGDPLEIMSFSIDLPDTSQVYEAELLITKDNTGGTNPLVKYIIFRGNAIIDEYYSGQPLVNKSTIVGHANSAHAIAVGAVLYSNTPAFGNLASIASFSSTGGTPVNGVTRLKPELTAPNGVNTSTTIPLGPDNNGSGVADGFPNFYGTSAAAPHAAAAAALVLEARKKYYSGNILTPAALKFFLFNSAITMQPDGVVNGVNYKAGYGLVQADGAIRSFANPTPQINSLVYNAGIVPGTAPFTLTVVGQYLTNTSQIYFRGQPLVTTQISSSQLQAQVSAFIGNPAINVYTPPFPGATGDGGLSNTLYFFSTKKDTVTIVADNKTKKYGEALPVLSTTILVNGDSLHVYNAKTGKSLTREQLGVASPTIRYTDESLNTLSNVGIYQIRASRPFDATNQTDVGLLEKYKYDSTFGNLQITKLAVTLSPRDTTIVYGEPLDNFNFNYVFDPSANIADPVALTNIVKASHELNIDNSVLGVINNNEGGGAVVIFNGKVLPVLEGASVVLDTVIGGTLITKLLPVVTSSIDGGAVVIFNGQERRVVNSAIDGGAVVIFNNEENSVENGGGAVVIFNGEILPVVASSLDGGAVVIFNGQELRVQNNIDGGAVVIFNGQEVPVLNGEGGAVVIFNGQYYPVVKNSEGGAVVIFNGQQLPVQNTADGGAVVIFNGQAVSVTDGGSGAVVIFNGQLLPVEVNTLDGGAVVIFNGNPVNVPYINGEGGGAVVIFNGQILPVSNGVEGGGAVVIFNGEILPVRNSLDGGAVVIFNGTTEVPVVNSVSAATLTNMSILSSTNAIANARTVGGQTNKFVDVSSNAFANFNNPLTNARLINAYPYTNARALVEANSLVGGAVTIFNSAGGAVTIFNGSGGIVNGNTLGTSTINRTPVIVDQADVNSTSTNPSPIVMMGINMITGITAGVQTLIPATLLNPNLNLSYGQGKVTITKAPITIKASDATKIVGDVITLNPAAFTITAGAMKYREKISLVSLSSTGTTGSAAIGNYNILASNAVGAYGTDVSNYNISYQNGNLSVVASPCPVITHSKSSGFVSTVKAPVSLWVNVTLKVRGDLINVGDYIAFKAGQITIENVTSETSLVNVSIPQGKIMAANVPAPITRYDAATQSFITLVPPGFSTTADVFISGGLINSKNGFTKKNGAGSVIKGILQSNVNFVEQWSYAMAAYTATGTPPQYVQLTDLSVPGSVVSVHGANNAGTPLPWLSRITAGGTGNGGTNYTGSPSSNDNFTACIIPFATTAADVTARQRLPEDVEENVLSSGLQIFPNPAATSVTISFVASVKGSASIGIYSLNGVKINEVYAGAADAGKLYTRQMNTGNLANGLYIIRLQEKGKVVTQKLIINRR